MRPVCRISSRARATPLQARGQGLDAVEGAGHATLVLGQHHALGEHIGDDLQPLQAHVLDVELIALEALFGIGRDVEVQGLDLGLGQGIGEERLHLLEERDLLQRRGIEEHGGAVAKQHHAPLVRDG